MKRLTVFGLMTLALAAALLIGAGGTGSGVIDPHSHKYDPLAVVKDDSGGVSNSQFGELAYGSERYLMIINADCDTAVSVLETCSLTLCPGPGTYQIIRYLSIDTFFFVDTLDTLTTALSSGEITVVLDSVPVGGYTLLHFDPVPPDTSYQLSLSYPNATHDVNGRKIAVDKFGRIHVCYTDKSGDTLVVWYARSDNACSTWQKQRIANNAARPAIAVDTFGVPYIAYQMGFSNPRRVCLCSEGIYDTLGSDVPPGTSPTLALSQQYGLVVGFWQDKAMLGGSPRYLHFPKKKQMPLRLQVLAPTYTYGLSSCYSNEGMVVTAGRSIVKSTKDELFERVDPELHTTNRSFARHYISGEHGDPSLGRQGNEIWAVYYQKSSKTIRYKQASRHPCKLAGHYKFPEGSGDSIAAIPSGYGAMPVQIADGLPFVVWEQSNSTVSHSKIFYSYKLQTDDTSWSAPESVSSNPGSIIERYPHVDHDYDNKKIYVIWTQYGGTDTIINHRTLTYEDIGWDSVRVINPNGPRKSNIPQVNLPSCFVAPGYKPPWYWLGETIDVVWSLTGNAIKSCIYAKYNYPGGSWDSLGTTYGSDTTFEWETKKAGDSCRVKVVVWYPGGKSPYDISDENFQIRSRYIKPVAFLPIEQIDGGDPLFSLSEGSLQTLAWQAYSFSGLDTTNLLATVNGGTSFSFVGDSCSYDSTLSDTVISGSDTLYGYEYIGTTYWTAPSTPTSYGYLRLMAVDTTSDTVYSYDFYPFRIPGPGGFQYNTYSNQEIMSLNDNGNKIGLVYTAQDPDTADKLSVVYMESDEGLDFSAPDTVGGGRWPAFSCGACFWQNFHDTTVYHPDTLFYAYQLNDTFATPYPFLIISPDADSGGFAPVGVVSENDTVYAVIRTKLATHEEEPPKEVAYYSLVTLFTVFPEASPGMACVMDTLQYSTSTDAANYNVGDYAPSVVKRDSVVYCAYNDAFNCYFATITPSGKTTTTIGQGLQPSVSCSEGNITYTYLGSGDTSLIRLWRYLDDTTWVERDTFYLDDDAEVLCGEEGLMYGVQREDTFLADLYVYDPISEEYYLTQEYTGYYPHTYLDDEASEFGWITAFADYVDSSTTYMHTERHDMNVILPALYQEADDKRSPYTLYRDTCIHYTSVDVDSAADSLIYRFPHLNTSEDYAVIVEFYTECDSITQLQVTVGSTVDTIQIPANSFSWYEQNIASSTDTLNLAIRRLSQFGFVPVSRVLVRRRSSSGFFMSAGGPQSAGPIQIPFCLYQPFPNPFADAATIRYSLPYATHVSLKIYDVSGRLVSKLVDGEVEPGVHELRWTGKDDVNRRCASGVYFVRFQAADYQASKKMVLIK